MKPGIPALIRACMAAALVFAVAAPSGAILPTVSGTPAGTPTATQAEIDADREAGQDDRIRARIAGIFAEVPSLADVNVSVQQGVVTLGGTVADPEARLRAEAIAGRVQGVATVENTITRDVSVDSGLGLGDLRDRISEFTHMLPLIGAAIIVALVISAFGYLLASFTGLWRRFTPNAFLAELIASAIRFVFVIGGLVIALDMIGAGALLGAVLGGAGVVGIALGFAMRDTIENYVASLMLSVRQPFRPNDHVEIDGKEGRVIRLTSRATIMMTLDGNHLRVPNAQVFKAVILNYTRNPQRRFDFALGIDAEDDPTAARQLGVEVLKSLDFVLDEPEPQAVVDEVGDSNIVIRFLGWIDQRQTDWYKARSRAIPAVKTALEDAGFALPEPIYRLRFDNGVPPFAMPQGERTQAAAPPRRKPEAAREEARDTSPESEIARMVEAEREAGGEPDLLDPSRPVE
ncbi:small-conductance mechanosensitive channel [Altererythrobacter atlanticus]|uniref:Small-conductance mechanosensitive channel n=1 Tax=Croceibacterium atlanticum TaxID=1267766 RepID=A0A0F7KTA0_9SPHN|nr:mechanosensitive ion channel family protein [Croceibacterium atlanticum]AKH43633.1 Small-conductance mechanosensitive channel [Croceibacterium atlanticum]MBB5733883.1 small-conductance mechanosensitive channel [Croceibacterium atlanticum]